MAVAPPYLQGHSMLVAGDCQPVSTGEPGPILQVLAFGAQSWCPACRKFMPLLTDLEEECATLDAGKPAFSVLYIPFDRNEDEYRYCCPPNASIVNFLHRLIFFQLRPLKSLLLPRRYALQSLPRHWYALAHSIGETASLARTFGVSVLPTLVVVRRKDGAIVAGAQMARKQAVAGPTEVKKWMHLAQRPLPCPPDPLPAARQVDSTTEATAA